MSEPALATVCAWCERVRSQAGEWRRDERWPPPAAATTHGICPECLERTVLRETMMELPR